MNEPKKKRGRPPGSGKKIVIGEPIGPLTITMPAISRPGEVIKIVAKEPVIINKPGYDPFLNPRFIAKMKIKSDEK